MNKAQFDAIELITQRTLISQRVSELLTERATQFGLLLDDISIVSGADDSDALGRLVRMSCE